MSFKALSGTWLYKYNVRRVRMSGKFRRYIFRAAYGTFLPWIDHDYPAQLRASSM